MSAIDKAQQRQLDMSLCRIAGEFGAAMKHAYRMGDEQLYEQLREQRLAISALRDSVRDCQPRE